MNHKLSVTGLLIAACFVMQAVDAVANNIAVTNIGLTDSQDNYTHVQFDIGWDNSWRMSSAVTNWDAAWVFVKYRPGDGIWRHATLATNGHAAPTGSTIDSAADGTGVFIYRDAVGSGTTNYPGVKLRWNYSEDGLTPAQNIDVAVFAIEMVYIPEGSFYVGDGTSTDIKGQFESGTNGNPFQITNESYEITLGGGSAGSLGNNNTSGMLAGYEDDFNDTTSTNLPAAFPKGYNAFYCMKYEISQGQYANFLNMLTSTQEGNRKIHAEPNYTNNRGTISGSYTNYSASAPDRACNFLKWGDGAAYADWAGLRPMTELEFEKACRGPLASVAGEYAWGSTNIYGSSYTLSNDGQPNAEVSNPGSGTGNASYYSTDGSIEGPLRCGIFAASTTNPTREEAGAAYHGVMEMSGNVWERVVTVGNADGRGFTGTYGDGELDGNGEANVSSWPAGATASGTGFRGAAWGAEKPWVRLSDRFVAAITDAARGSNNGWRGVRSAP